MERSWPALGLKKPNLDRLLAGPRAPRRLVLDGLGAKSVAKNYPGGFQNWAQKGIKLNIMKTLKNVDAPKDFHDF